MNIAILLITYLILQVIAAVLFKFGSMATSRWLTCFIIGNIFGASSIWFIMKLYTKMNVNLVTALAGGGAFLCIQTVLAVVFHSRPAALHWLGYLMIAVGLCLASMNIAENLNK